MKNRVHFNRRQALKAALPLAVPLRAIGAEPTSLVIDVGRTSQLRFDRERFGFVGVYDADWLPTPGFDQMLDVFAASPGAIHGVRMFGILSAGYPERYKPENGGTIWSSSTLEPDFTPALDALAALTTRDLIPFLSLGFFPTAVSSSPIQPPDNLVNWQYVLASFLQALVNDSRFGFDRVGTWWFEVWNEPNEGRFWGGTQEDYFALYRATSAVITASGLPVRLGGPAIAWKPEANLDDGIPWMERFLRFIAADPLLRCDFISFHRKGTVDDSPPDLRRLHGAAQDVRALLQTVDPVRFAGLPIINNEADEKVGFEVPYAPRMTHQNASWLAAITSLHAGLSLDEGPATAAADNANLQLVDEPFDGRRSLLTWATAEQTELIKLAPYGLYEMLRLLHGHVIAPTGGNQLLFPTTDIYHLAVADENQIGVLLTWYPDATKVPIEQITVPVMVSGLPWHSVNRVVFLIDGENSSAWTAAGGSAENPYPKPMFGSLPAVRLAQELTIADLAQFGIEPADGTWTERLTLNPFSTVLMLITETDSRVPEAPVDVSIARADGRMDVSWQSDSVDFLTYEVCAMQLDGSLKRISPPILRASRWSDAEIAADVRLGVRTISMSGIQSPFSFEED